MGAEAIYLPVREHTAQHLAHRCRPRVHRHQDYGTPPGGIDFSVRGEWTLCTNDLGLDVSDLPLETLVLLGNTAEDLPQSRWITRNEWKLGATLSF
jgi:hypothetical protein